MKCIVAIIKPFRLDDVREALSSKPPIKRLAPVLDDRLRARS